MGFKDILHRGVAHSERLMKFALGLTSLVEAAVQSGYKDREVLALIGSVRREKTLLLTVNEALILHSFTRTQRRRPGAMAEVGVYQGCSAKLMCEAKGDKTLHLFDTFEGLPAPGPDEGLFRERDCRSAIDDVRRYLSGYDGVVFHKGRFPDTGVEVAEESFSMVHLDVDLYRSTLDSLVFFHPRMTRGGVILSHDYTYGAGVRRAFDEFFADRDELVLELTNSQCMVVKL